MKTIVRAFAGAVTRGPILVLGVVLVLSGVFGALATTLENADGQEGFSPESDEILASERIGALFGESATQSVMQIVVRSEAGDVLSVDGLSVADQIAVALRASDVGAFISDDPQEPGIVSFMVPVQQAIAAQGLDPSTLDDDGIKALYADALARGGAELGFASQLLPDDAGDQPDSGLVLVFVDTTQDVDAQVAREVAVAEVVAGIDVPAGIELRPFSFSLLFGGVDDFLGEVAQLFVAAFVIIVGVLLFVYWMKPRGRTSRGASLRRTLADTGVTMLTIILVIAWMNGIGALLQRVGVLGPLTEVAQIVPILLIGLGVDYGIHLTSRYRDEVGDGASVDAGMRTAIGTVGIALTLATVTTAIGFLTNIVNPIPALRDFGILAAIGIVVSFLLMLTFVPALRVLLDRRAEAGERLPREGMGATRERFLPEVVGRSAVLAEKAPVPTLAVMLVLGVLGYAGLSNLSTEFSFTDFLPDDSPVVQTLDIIEEEFGGGFGETTQVLVEGEQIASPEAFNAMGDAIADMADTPDVLSIATPAGPMPAVSSLVSALQQLSSSDPDGGPADPAFARFATENGYDPSTGRMDPDADTGAILAAARRSDPAAVEAVVAFDDEDRAVAAVLEISTQAGEGRALDLQEALEADLVTLEEAGVSTIATSQNIITGDIVDSLSASQVTSLLITLVAATLVLMASFWVENRRPFLGVLTMIPVALVVLWTFGLMYVSGIPFGPVTATLTGLAVGIGVPYTIHMTRRFEEDRVAYDGIDEAIRASTRNTGGALAGSAFTTAAGFGILMTSSLTPFQQMGQVTAYAIVLSLAGSVLVLPSLLVLWERWHRRRGDAAVEQETLSVT